MAKKKSKKKEKKLKKKDKKKKELKKKKLHAAKPKDKKSLKKKQKGDKKKHGKNKQEKKKSESASVQKPEAAVSQGIDHSSNYNVKDAVSKLRTLESKQEVMAFIEGEKRLTVTRALPAVLNRLG